MAALDSISVSPKNLEQNNNRQIEIERNNVINTET